MRIVGWTALVLLLGFGFLVSHGFYRPDITWDMTSSENRATGSQDTETQDAATQYATDDDRSYVRRVKDLIYDFITDLFPQHDVTKEKATSTEAQNERSGLGSSMYLAPSISGVTEKAGDSKRSRPPRSQSVEKTPTAARGFPAYADPILAVPAVQASPFQVPGFQVPPFQVPAVQPPFQVPTVPTFQVPAVPSCCVAP
jgi:hypothetical protein